MQSLRAPSCAVGAPRNFALRAAAGAAVWACCATPAHADSFEATRSDRLVERDHDIAMTLDYGHAELVVRRTVFNGGDRHDQAMFWIDVPDGGVAVGLRTLATLGGRPHWYEGELLEAELAASRYRELTGIGGYYPKDPALLSWRSPEQLALQVFPCPPQQAKSVEYTMVLPTRYEEGRYQVELPQLGTEELPARITVRGASARDQVFVDGLPVGRGSAITMDADHAFALGRAAAPTLDGGLAVVSLGDDRALFHFDIEAARNLSRVPRHADVVVVLDRSRSIDDADREAEVVLARSYLSHFEAPGLDARAAIVSFDRRPDDLLRGLVPAAQAAALLEHTTLAARNGSNVDGALGYAAGLLDRSKPGRVRRIVLLTDRRTRSGLTTARLEALARRTGAVVHVVGVSATENDLERNDDHAWAAIAQGTGGVLWDAGVTVGGGDVSARDRVFEELARPVRIHHLAIEVPGMMASDLSAPETLDEGMGTSALLLADRRIPHVVLTGHTWSEPVRKVLLPDADEAKLWSALVFGTEVLGSLTEPEMMVLAMRGRAVSPVTSYLAIEPGVRPSTEGLEEGEGLGLVGFGAGGGGSGTGFGRSGHGRAVDRPALLRRHLRAALDTCGTTAAGSAKLETTLAEIVEVAATVDGGDAVIEDCVREELWKVELVSAFTDEFATWDVHA